MKQDSTFGKILIIDDERDNTEIIKDILEDVSYTTMLARSAIEAKAIIAANTFDLILMDVWMPGQDGISLLSGWHSAGLSTPIVMMSGHAEPSDIIDQVFEPYITTKVNSGGLGLAIVQNIIEQHDGQIFASNVKPHGARVTIELSIIENPKGTK